MALTSPTLGSDQPAAARPSGVETSARPSVLRQRLGRGWIPWAFLAPNLVIFGLFTFLPVLVNFYYAGTGGIQLSPQERPWIGTKNFEALLTCGNYLNPASCQLDLFWRAVYNTAQFVALQVGFMVLFALLTALVLNGPIRARGFFRSVFFYPGLLSPVVVALVWKWILQREGLLNAAMTGLGGEPQL